MGFGQGGWQNWPAIVVSAGDVGHWLFSVGALVKLASFLTVFTGLPRYRIWGMVASVMFSFFFHMKGGLGERLCIEDTVPKYRRPGRPMLVSAAPLCPDADIWRLCRYLGGVLRALCRLPGGLERFVLGRIGANRVRPRHVGWEKCCHGLTCRPGESSGDLGDLFELAWLPFEGLVLPYWVEPLS